MDKSFFGFKWTFLFAVFLAGQFFFFLDSSAYAEWTTVDPPDVSSNWELFNPRSNWAVGQDSENRAGVLLYLFKGSWIRATLPEVSSDWALSGANLTSSIEGWAVGRDLENKRGVLLLFKNPAIPALPTITTTRVSDITPTTATGGGDITSDGGNPVTARGVCWSTSADPGLRGTCTSDGTGTGVFTSSITGLMPGTLYHVRAYATNSVGTAYGNDLTFSTAASSLPTVTTTAISNVTFTTATGGGDITSDGGKPVTARGVCWSTSPNPVLGSTCTSDGTGTGAFSSSIAGLIPGTLYHVRAYATSSVGTAYGNDIMFSTSASTLTLPGVLGTRSISDTAAAGAGSNLIWRFQSVVPTDVSSDWALSALHFSSPEHGWAVGEDYENERGVLLRYVDGSWTSVIPPNVSSNWGLSAVHFRWAVGQDLENETGVIMYFSGGSWTSVSPPDVSSSWGLSGVFFLSSREAWAVGQDSENKRGVLLHFLNGSWTSEIPPDVSSDWGLSSVDFLSPDEGWAVGEDFINGRGVLLHFLNDSWSAVSPPDINSHWGLSGIQIMSPDKGWAVGQISDGSNTKGVLLQYTVPQISVSPMRIDYNRDVEIGALLEKTVTVRNTGNGDLVVSEITVPSPPFYIGSDDCSGKSLARSQTCKVTYRFLPISAGTFSGNSNILSNGSSSGSDEKTVTLIATGVGETLNSISLLSPDAETFTACDYSDPPAFRWDSSGTFTNIEIQFSSDFSQVPPRVKSDAHGNQLTPKSKLWKRVLRLPGNEGGPLDWRVVAKIKDKTVVQSDVFSFEVGPPEPAGNPEMSHTSKTAPPPTLSWDNNCNRMFTVWFGNDSDFSNPHMKKMSVSFKLKDFGGPDETFTKELTPDQWNSIRKLGGDVAGATLYWYIDSEDILGRRQTTEVMSFVLTN